MNGWIERSVDYMTFSGQMTTRENSFVQISRFDGMRTSVIFFAIIETDGLKIDIIDRRVRK
jgi:hypothetical protein